MMGSGLTWAAILEALLPPTGLALLAVILLVARRPRWSIVVTSALVLLSVDGVPHMLVTPLLRFEPAGGAGAPGAIVVVASGLPEWLDPSRTVPSMETLKSLRTAASMHRRTGLPILVSGARASDGDVPVADAMAASLRADFDVPIAWQEAASTNLWQSASATAGILRPAGIAGIYLVAQPWELRLGTSVFAAAGLQVTPAPVPYRRQRTLDLTGLVAFTPAWLESAIAIHQWAGLACQSMPLCVLWMRNPS